MAKKTNKSGKKKKPQEPANSFSKKQIKREVLDFFQSNPGKEYNYKQISSQLDVRTKKEKEKLLNVLQSLYEKGALEEDRPGKYVYEFKTTYEEGIVDMTKKGHAYIIVDDKEQDIYVPSGKLKTAINGDRVKVLMYAQRKGRRPEGEVVEILKRNKTRFVGNLEIKKNYGFLTPDDRKVNVDIFIPPENLGNAKNGVKAEAEIVDWSDKGSNPVGKITNILGKPGEHNTEMNAIIRMYDLPVEFPKKVIQEAEGLNPDFENESKHRRDFRGIPTFTIDPEDAKDFDDGLSVSPGKDKGTWEIAVHIADVTHYVTPGSNLDEEAFNRATSIYLVDRVIPMLPERLSNELCSLRPDEDKLAFSAVFTLDSNANVLNKWFGKTLIRSGKRFTYEGAQDVLDKEEGPFAKELKTLNKLAYKLRDKRFKEGAISFETEEVQFELDEKDRPVDVTPLIRKDAHKLIEDFMLLANREVAKFIYHKGGTISRNPFVYRVHDAPDQDKLAKFAKIAARFGFEIDATNNKTLARSFNRLLENVEGKPEQNMIQSLAIRTMAKAFYTTKKSDHYGLALDYYSHFTSPIRRYPDVITHRLLEAYLNDLQPLKGSEIEQMCKHCSAMEVKAEEAERASIKYKQVEYLQTFIGEVFDGIISGVTEFGFFVELSENKCEGLVHMSSLLDDHYYLDENNYRLVGVNKGKTYQLGDYVQVRILETNLIKRTVTLDVIKSSEGKR